MLFLQLDVQDFSALLPHNSTFIVEIRGFVMLLNGH